MVLNGKTGKKHTNMSELEYEMYQDMPRTELGAENSIYGKDYLEFQKYIKKSIKDETSPDPKLHNATTIRYIYYVDDYPIGEVGIRMKSDEFWQMRGRQLFYKIRLSERQKEYVMRMMKLALEECRKLGFEQVMINCSNMNYGF